MIRAALALASATGKPDTLKQAETWASVLDAHYWSDDLGGYFVAADDTDDLIVRPFGGLDDATPNANATMVENLTSLSLWTGKGASADRAAAILKAFGPAIAANPVGHSGLLSAAVLANAPALIVLMVPGGESAAEMRGAMRDVSLPNAVFQEIEDGTALPRSSPAHGKTAVDGKVTAYVCVGPQCSLPVTDPDSLARTVKSARQAGVR